MDKPVKEPKPTWVKEFRQAVLDNDIEVLELAGYLTCIGEIKLRTQQYEKLSKLANKYGWDGELLPTLLHFIIDVNDLLGGNRREYLLKLIELGKFLNED